VAGAFLQEGIDVLVIVNALRALRGGVRRRPLSAATEAMLEQFSAEHEKLRDALTQLGTTADLIATNPEAPDAVGALRATHRRLVEEVLPHELAEEHRLYPALARPLGSGEATATMSRAHVEIHRLVDRIDGHLAQVSDSRLRAEQIPDLLANLYGLHAVLRLHFTQEEEDFFALSSGGGLGAPSN
jgi:iron-sulfur cluster repair protein YtfE (RIC family)